MDKQCEQLQRVTEEDAELGRLMKQQELASIALTGHIARSGLFHRAVLLTQTPFSGFAAWLDRCTEESDAGDELFTVCLTRASTAVPWGLLIRSAPDLSSGYCVVAGCTAAKCVDASGHPLARLPLHTPLRQRSAVDHVASPARAAAAAPVAPAPIAYHASLPPRPVSNGAAPVSAALSSAHQQWSVAAAATAAHPSSPSSLLSSHASAGSLPGPPPPPPPLTLQPGDIIVGVGSLDLSLCAFEYSGPHVSAPPPAAGAPESTAGYHSRSAAFGAAYLALKHGGTRLLLRVRRPAASSKCAAAPSQAASGAPVDNPPSLRPCWASLCCDEALRAAMVRLLLLESKSSKWWAAATKQFLEGTLAPKVLACLFAAESPPDELLAAWGSLASAISGGEHRENPEAAGVLSVAT
jgi:hypothetical protein